MQKYSNIWLFGYFSQLAPENPVYMAAAGLENEKAVVWLKWLIDYDRWDGILAWLTNIIIQREKSIERENKKNKPKQVAVTFYNAFVSEAIDYFNCWLEKRWRTTVIMSLWHNFNS